MCKQALVEDRKREREDVLGITIPEGDFLFPVRRSLKMS